MKVKKLLSTALAVAMVLNTGSLSVLAATGTTTYQDGTYTGTATVSPDEYEDFEAYDIKVNVGIADGAITSVSFADNNFGDAGNATYANWAMNGRREAAGVASQILSKQGTSGVDAVSGATCTSAAIVSAVNSALSKATATVTEKVDKSELEKVIKEAEKLTEADYTADSWSALETALSKAKEVLKDRKSVV